MTRLVLLAAVGLVGCGRVTVDCPNTSASVSVSGLFIGGVGAAEKLAADFCGGAK